MGGAHGAPAGAQTELGQRLGLDLEDPEVVGWFDQGAVTCEFFLSQEIVNEHKTLLERERREVLAAGGTFTAAASTPEEAAAPV